MITIKQGVTDDGRNLEHSVWFRWALLLIPCFLPIFHSANAQSVLGQGVWVKIGVTASGVYRLDQAALARLEELAEEDWVREDTAERVRGMFGYRRSRFVARKMGVDEDGYEERSQAYQRLSRELLLAQRNALVRLRNEGTISDEALHRIERDLDLEETRLDS